jgi:hypothetical protein
MIDESKDSMGAWPTKLRDVFYHVILRFLLTRSHDHCLCKCLTSDAALLPYKLDITWTRISDSLPVRCIVACVCFNDITDRL